MLRGGERINVVPERSTAQLDVRLLPDTDVGRLPRRGQAPAGPGFDGQGAGDLAARAGVAGLRPALPGDAAGCSGPRRRWCPPSSPASPTRASSASGGSPPTASRRSSSAPRTRRGSTAPTSGIPLAEIDRGVERMRRILTVYAAVELGQPQQEHRRDSRPRDVRHRAPLGRQTPHRK